MISSITYYPKVIIVWHSLKNTKNNKLPNTQTKFKKDLLRFGYN
jgi:hypothetical protein